MSVGRENLSPTTKKNYFYVCLPYVPLNTPWLLDLGASKVHRLKNTKLKIKIMVSPTKKNMKKRSSIYFSLSIQLTNSTNAARVHKCVVYINKYG